jgi:cyclopropane-fatty-acyl-phospholipid synthase
VLEPGNFSVQDVENLRPHYALTLRHWRARYEACIEDVAEEYGRSFARTWRLYLAGAEAGFTSGDLQLFQVLFGRRTDDSAPWTRRALYGAGQ